MSGGRVIQFLKEKQAVKSGDEATKYAKLEELYNKKLWHQLTVTILDYLQGGWQGEELLEVYENFISDFEHKINCLSLVEMCMNVAKEIKDAEKCLQFLDKIREKVKRHKQAVCLCLTAKGIAYIHMKDLGKTKEIIEESRQLIDEFDGVTPVHDRFYELSSEYYKQIGDYDQYYKECLRYLGCVDPSMLTEENKKTRAFSLGLAAILGENVYNFGELLAHPVLDSLKQTDKQWLIDLLLAFNSGNLSRFEGLREEWSKQPDIVENEQKARQKIILLCLMEMTFKRPAANRKLTFQEIAAETTLPVAEVELLVMRALSYGLVRGLIDQVNQVVYMTWVQPRVLDVQQLSTMKTQLSDWTQSVKNVTLLVEDKAHDLVNL